MSGGLLIAVAAGYAALLFALAWWAEADGGLTLRLRRWSYTLALAVYCTSWTFYGAVGSAYADGWSYLPIYLGPMLMFLFGVPLLRRLIIAVQSEGSTSISDFIAARHQRNPRVAALVTIIALVGIIPYLALQLRSIGTSYVHVAGGGDPATIMALSAGILALFAMLFGTRRFDAAGRSEGLLFAVAVESLVKLVAFLAVGGFALWLFLAQGAGQQAAGLAALGDRFAPDRINADFFVITLLSAAAIICLPRQFYVGVIEASSPDDAGRARRPFTAYLVITALTVVPITLAGLTLASPGTTPDFLVIDLPVAAGRDALALLVFVGGFSASTAMVVVETIALATMVSNDLAAPMLLRSRRWAQVRDVGAVMLAIRRVTIAALMVIAFLFAMRVAPDARLASIGLIAFAAVAQIAPLLWLSLRRGGRDPAAALAGLGSGFALWLYTLLLPAIAPAGTMAALDGGWADPHALFGIDGLSPIAHGSLWSLSVNIAVTALVAARRLGRPRISIGFADRVASTAVGTRDELVALVGRFVGQSRAQSLLSGAGGHGIDRATARRAERLMAGVVGAASARALIASALSGERLTVADVAQMLDHSGQSLQFSRDLLAATLENIDPGVSVVDADLNLVAWNSRYLDMFDYPPGMIHVGASVDGLIRHNALRGECGPGEVEAHVERRLAAMRRAQRHSFERVRPDGRVLQTVGGPMPGGGYVMCFTDITAEATARAALEASRAELEARVTERTAALSSVNAALAQATADKTRFLAAASHDLLQPLHAARLFSGALDRRLDDDARPLLGRIDRSIEAADLLLRTLLDISKLDAGGIVPAPELFALRPLLAELVDSFAPLATEKGLTLRLGPGDAMVQTDRVLLRSIVQNLLSNAVRYTATGGVLVGVRRRGGTAQVVVIDTGPGIATDAQARIFREFERLATRDTAGMGLGLAIVERTALLLGLSIDLTSVPGRGSRFDVTLPAIAGRPAAAAAAGERHAPAATGSRRLAVLVVDDDPLVGEAMHALLTAGGDAATVVTSAAAALAGADEAAGPFDVVLLDYDLGEASAGTDGITLAGRIRARWPTTAMALITADTAPTLAQRAAAAGLPLMPKPVDPAALTAWLDGVR